MKNIAHSIFQKLLNKSRQLKIDFNLLLIRYSIERFLYRISKSEFSDYFILKGASVFLVWCGQNYRTTRDIDFLCINKIDKALMTEIFKNICNIDYFEEDGIKFIVDSVEAEDIKEQDLYKGIRVCLIALLNKARITVQIDIGFGDIVSPESEVKEFPTILDGNIPILKTYSLYNVISEKFEAIVNLGMANSRMKDFYDIWLISKLFNIEAELLCQAIINTFKRRKTLLPKFVPVGLSEEFYNNANKLKQWNAFVRKTKPVHKVEQFSEVIAIIVSLLLPLIEKIHSNEFLNKTWKADCGWI